MVDPHATLCRECLVRPRPFEQCIVPFQYAQPIDQFIVKYKRFSDETTGAILTRLMRHTLPDELHYRVFDSAVIPVPMHSSDLRKRGFNQSHQLAQAIAQQFNLPLNNHLRATRTHTSQKALHANQRRQNLAGVFEYSGLAPRHCLIVDDVMTTGATVTAVAEELKQQGSEQISVICLARTPSSRV